MELLDVIRNRHSIRVFTDDPVHRAELEDLVQCAVLAPTTSNMQAWRFVAVTDPTLVRKITAFSPGISGKPAAIIVLCSDQIIALTKGGEVCGKEFATIDISLAAQNIMLRAVDLGLGSCAVKSFQEAAVRKLLNVPDHIRVEYLIVLGRPSVEGKSPARRPMEEVLVYDRFDK